MKLLSTVIAATLVTLPVVGQSLLVTPDLSGSTETAVWSNLSIVNTVNIPGTSPQAQECLPDQIFDTSVDFRVYAPGKGANSGLYSWSGGYQTTLLKTTSNFAIKQAVFQLDLVWDPATAFPHSTGPRLSYNGGNQNLAPLPMILGGSREIDNETGVEDIEGIEHFVYRGVMWQWDLSQVEGDIHTITISTPYANHTSVVASRLDIASEFEEIGGNTATPLQLWRDNYFQTTANEGDAADRADPDHDGIPNLIEYALGTRPDSNDEDHGSSNLPATSISEERLHLHFTLPSSPPAELQYRVRASSDLVIWTTLATKAGASPWVWTGTGPTRIALPPSDERQPVTIGDDITTPGNETRFMRLEISY